MRHVCLRAPCILIYIAEALVFQHRSELQSNNFEHIWADVRINEKTYAINALYRPPNESPATN